MQKDSIIFILLHISAVMIFVLLIFIARKKRKKQIHKAFMYATILQLIWCIAVIVGTYLKEININFLLYSDYFAYIGVCLIPVIFLFIGLIYAKSKVKLTIWHYLLFVIPVLSLLILWTNDWHHLFYVNYSFISSEIVYGKYFIVHSIYSYICIAVGLFYLIYFSIKNVGFFSRQVFLIILGTLAPILVNILYTLNVISLSLHATPVSFAFAIMCYMFAILKYDFLSISPVALQSVVDRISDSFIVVNEDSVVIDYNLTLKKTFSIDIKRNLDINESLKESLIDQETINIILDNIKISKDSSTTKNFERHIVNGDFDHFFKIETTPIINNNMFIGIIVLFKDITQSKRDLETIQQNHTILMEQERLASLGQLIGGIAHNLKTPIMTISGGLETIKALSLEYNDSIEDENVTIQDHHDIAKDLVDWVAKIKPYCSYMSDIISAVKNQAVTLSDSTTDSFTLGDLLKRVEILMKYELKQFHCTLKTNADMGELTEFKGEVNNLVQIFDNIIVNSIQSYGKKRGTIDLRIVIKENQILFAFKDYGCGISPKVKEKLFKEMLTTKGPDGTGLGLYMSYATVKGRFNGEMWLESELGKGTTVYISIPYFKVAEKTEKEK